MAGSQEDEGDGDPDGKAGRGHHRPPGGPEGAGDGLEGAQALVVVDPYQQPAVDGDEHGADGDPHEDEAQAGESAAQGDEVGHRPDSGPADEGGQGGREHGAGQKEDADEDPGLRTRAEADEVGRAQGVAGDGLEEGAGHAQGQARHEPQHDPGQLPLHHDDLDDLAPLPLERVDDLLGGDGELP